MQYKMVVMDIDDTLLDNNHNITLKNKNAIKKAQESGIKVVLASGRPTFGMEKIAKELELDKYESYIISFNGAIVTEAKTGKVLFEKALSKETAHKLYDISKEYKVDIHTYLDDDIIVSRSNEYTDIENEITGMNVKVAENFKKTVDRDVVKLIMLENPDYLKNVEEDLKKKLSNELSITISKPFFLEFTDKGINKATGIENLINRIGIKKEEVIAIGDSYNDLEMIQYAGLGVCVDNGYDDIKKHAKYIAKSNEDSGVAEVINKFIFNNID